MAERYPSQHRIMLVTPLPPTSDISTEDNAAVAPDWGNFAVNEATELPERPETEDLRRLLHYWNARRGERAFPRRRDIDPLDFWYMIDRVALTEVHDDPRRYRLRLVGGFWGRLVGFEATGMWLDDWPHPNQRKLTEDSYEKLVAGRVPRLARRDSVVDYQTLRYEIMLLPMSEDGSRVSMIVAGIGQH
ncbi:MAG TPA: PAS domain-containing protein [Dongiaceae bacterium]|nr:PAS domain-containing protein [Dongiaceae bacterium]